MFNTRELNLTAFSQNEVVSSIREASQDTPIIVDFDETLFLRNSTSEYLNSLQPRLVASILTKTISFLKPWKLFNKFHEDAKSRDWFLVFIATILMPWNLFFWQKIARNLAIKHSNYELAKELNQNTNANIIVATLGFKFIINPILKNMPVNYNQLIGCRFWQGLTDRHQGKLLMVKKSLNDSQIAASVLITDSLDDLPLLKQVAQPLLILWNKAQYNSPMSDVYFPMMYIHKVKRVGEEYIQKAILLDDLPLILLTFSWLSPQPFLHGLGISFLLISFWCIYEFGYYENDLVAEKYESNPVLSDTYHKSLVTMNWWQPWIWALSLGGAGVFFVVGSGLVTIFDGSYLINNPEKVAFSSLIPFAAWTGFLLLSRLCFWIYNYLNKQTRIWFYFVLQVCRYCGYLVVMGTNLAGISLLLAQVLARSISYIVYRYTGGIKANWPKLQEKFLRFLLFVLLIVSISIAESNLSLLLNWHTAAIFVYCLVRAKRHIDEIVDTFGLIQQDKAKNLG